MKDEEGCGHGLFVSITWRRKKIQLLKRDFIEI
jgi:hypothetical protein